MAMLNNQRVTFSLKIAMGVRLSARIPHACVIPWGFSGAIRLSGCALLPAGRVRPSVPAAVYLFCLLLVDFPCNSTSSTRARSILSFGYHLGWILLLLLAGDFFPALQLACFFSLALQWPTLFSGSTVTYTGQFWYSYLWIAIYKFLDSGGRKEDQLFCGTELDNPWCFQFAISSQFMCSFLLLFLILIVGFDFLQNSITKFHPEEALSKATCACPSYLAFALQESEGSWTGGTAPTVLDICWSSFKGPYLSQKDSSRDQEAAKDNGARALSLALYDLSAHQQKDCREVCHLFSTLVDWHTSWDGTQDTSSNRISRCLAAKRAAICLGRLGVSRSIMELASNSKEVAKPLNQLPFGKGVSESKRTQRKRCREACSQRQTQEQGHHLQCRECRRIRRHELQQFTICPLTSSLPPWPSLEGASQNLMPSIAMASNPSTIEQLAQKKECVAALRVAYPDVSAAPAETKELIEKMDKDIERLETENNKFVTKNIHSATISLGKAQKTLNETMEAKKAHRNRWIKHITEAVTTWQAQSQEYQKQQAAFQEVATKARLDVGHYEPWRPHRMSNLWESRLRCLRRRPWQRARGSNDCWTSSHEVGGSKLNTY